MITMKANTYELKPASFKKIRLQGIKQSTENRYIQDPNSSSFCMWQQEGNIGRKGGSSCSALAKAMDPKRQKMEERTMIHHVARKSPLFKVESSSPTKKNSIIIITIIIIIIILTNIIIIAIIIVTSITIKHHQYHFYDHHLSTSIIIIILIIIISSSIIILLSLSSFHCVDDLDRDFIVNQTNTFFLKILFKN